MRTEIFAGIVSIGIYLVIITPQCAEWRCYQRAKDADDVIRASICRTRPETEFGNWSIPNFSRVKEEWK